MFYPEEPKIFTFTKEERLASKKTINDLINNGNSFINYPFKIIWKNTELSSMSPAQIVINISKRNFRNAVKRNLLKRRIREVYRKHKHFLYKYLSEKNKQIAIMVLFIGREVLDYYEIETKLIESLEVIIKENEKNS